MNIADTFAGLGSGANVGGSTASDAVSVWTAHEGQFLSDGSGHVYPSPNNLIDYLTIDNRAPATTNHTVTWTTGPGSGGNGSALAGWQTGVIFRGDITNSHRSVRVRILPTGTSTHNVAIEEANDYGNYLAGTSFALNTGIVNWSASIRGATLTITLAGAQTASFSIPLSQMGAEIGKVGLYGFNPASGGMTATNGCFLSALTSTDFGGGATGYDLIGPTNLVPQTASITLASKYPGAFEHLTRGV